MTNAVSVLDSEPLATSLDASRHSTSTLESLEDLLEAYAARDDLGRVPTAVLGLSRAEAGQRLLQRAPSLGTRPARRTQQKS